VLELLSSGFLSLWLDAGKLQTLKTMELSTWLTATAVEFPNEAQSAPDPIAMAVVRQHLAAMVTAGMPVTSQGVWIQIGNQVVAENLGRTPLSAASLTKVATSLAALKTWGPDHQFTTLVGGTAAAQNGVLTGDLIVEGSGDPLFVWEEAIALGNALNQAGIRRVTGNLVITGNFAMNFETDPAIAGSLLKQGMNAGQWSTAASTQYANLPAGTPRPQVVIEGTVQVLPLAQAQARVTTPLVEHRSLPLSQLLKSMNIYSNNAMSEMLATDLGGARTVAQTAADAARVPVAEIQLINGSGLGNQNRISPRAVSAMLIAMQRYLQPRQLNVADLFPVIGRDLGTARRRQLPPGTTIKTGTLSDVSSLAGVLPTRDRGLVWFTIINVGGADLQVLHNQQDLLLQSLAQQWGAANPVPDSLRPNDARANAATNLLGAVDRNKIL
jgi:serine-type D-Ala-D-Ala carboxypeptidase/endopeptidase (penicillin-binding protein 4)